MKRLFRAVWTDKSLLLVLVPIAFLLTAMVVNRSATDDVERTSATSSTTTTTTVAANGDEDAVAEVPQPTYAPESFAAGGRTVTDDNGNLVRIPNGVAGGTSGGTYRGDAQVAGVSQTSPTAAAPDGAATTTTVPGATTTVPTTTTTTLPGEPTPVVSESPIGVLLPVSAIGVVGAGWIALSVRRRKRASTAAAAGSS